VSCPKDNGTHPISQWETSPLLDMGPVWDNSHAMTETFAQRLERIIRETPGLSMKGVSLSAGLGDTAVRDIIKGRSRNQKYTTIKAIADVLRMDISELMSQEEMALMSQDDADRHALMTELRGILEGCETEDLRAAIRLLKRN